VIFRRGRVAGKVIDRRKSDYRSGQNNEAKIRKHLHHRRGKPVFASTLPIRTSTLEERAREE
jgi:hypothetical protein